MRASYQGLKILNEFPIKIAQLIDYFVQIAALRHYVLAKSVLPLLLTLTHQFLFFFGSLLCNGFTLAKFNSPLVESFILLRNAALSLFLGIIRIKYKQKHANIGRIICH